nr:hypothetical protein [Tanacetum cinerariifolium]
MTEAKEMWEAIKSRFGGSTEDDNQTFLRSLPFSWSQVSLIIRTKPGVDTLNFDDLYNNLKVFESDVKGSTGSSSNSQNVAFVSSENTSSTNKVNTAYGGSTFSDHNSQKEGSSSYTDDLMYSFFANQSSGPQLDHEDLKQARDNGKRPEKQDEHKAMVTVDKEDVDWTGHAEDKIEDYALMAYNSSHSGSDTEVTFCSKVCEESYAKLKKLYDEQREQLGVASIEIQAYTLALKKVEAKLVCHQKSQLAYEEQIRFVNVKGMHAVPPLMTRNYMPYKSDFGIDEPKFTYGPKQSTTSESNAKTSDLDSYDSNSSVETLESVPKPVANEPKAVSEPKDNPHHTLKGKGIVDSGCSRHMTRNKAYLVDYQDFNGGPVAFGGSKVLLRVSRQHNMYSFNLENIVPSGSLACLIAKATVVESTKWHRRMTIPVLLVIKESNARPPPITVENQANKTVGLKAANNSAGTQDNLDAGKSKMNADHDQEFYVLPLWSSYTSTVKSSKSLEMLDTMKPSIGLKKYQEKDKIESKPDKNKKRKITPLFPSMLTQAAVEEGEDSGTSIESQPTPSPTQPSAEDQPPLTESSSEHDTSLDPRGHRAEGSLNLEGLSALCTNLSNRLLALETIKNTQAKEIHTLKARIKKLEKRCKLSISHHRAWLRSVSLLSKKKKLSKKESVSKQRRKKAKLGPTKDDSVELDDELDEDMEYMDTEEAVNEGRQSIVDTARPDVSTDRLDDDTARPDVSTDRLDDDTARPDVNTARQELSTASPTTPPTTTTIFDDEEMTLADTLIKLKDDKAKGTKAKVFLEEPESAKKMTMSDFDATQIARDEEIARQLEVELQAKELITDFVPIGSGEDERRIRDMNKKAEEESSDKGVDNTKKRKAGSRMKRMSKRQKTDVDLEEEEEKLKTFMTIESKFYHYDRHGEEGIYYRIFKSDRSSRWIKTFSEMVTRFDRLDLVKLYNLVMQRFETTTPEGVDLILWGDLRTIFEASVEDELWQNQEESSLKNRRYLLTTRTLEMMLSLRLIVESASDAAYDLLRFIQKHIDESGGYDRGEKDL